MFAAAVLFALVLGAARAQPLEPTVAFLDNMLAGKPQISAEQAKMVAGVWNATSLRRIGGSTADEALLATNRDAAQLTGAHRHVVESANTDTIDTVDVVQWIPAVQTDTGIFTSYWAINKEGKGEVTLQRFMGVALARPDGSVVLQATKAEDTGFFTALVKDGRMALLYMEGLEVIGPSGNVRNDDMPVSGVSEKLQVVDNQSVALWMYDKLSEADMAVVEDDVWAGLEKRWKGN